MTLHATVNTALTSALANTWAKELPPNPTWPAAAFDIDSQPEPGWAAGVNGGYTAHELNVLVMAVTIEELDVLLPADGGGAIRAALQAIGSYQFEEDSGDAEYERDPKVYARFLTVRLRTPRQ
jgi:hypothetical protein